jgi:hypothetical protein
MHLFDYPGSVAQVELIVAGQMSVHRIDASYVLVKAAKVHECHHDQRR